jgi:hypothetical protein
LRGPSRRVDGYGLPFVRHLAVWQAGVMIWEWVFIDTVVNVVVGADKELACMIDPPKGIRRHGSQFNGVQDDKSIHCLTMTCPAHTLPHILRGHVCRVWPRLVDSHADGRVAYLAVGAAYADVTLVESRCSAGVCEIVSRCMPGAGAYLVAAAGGPTIFE